jgi:parallel beta-helix repeat protein
MSRPRLLFLLAIGLLLAVHPMFAANYAVGTCKPSLPSYATISAAVSSVPPGSTVEVCPNTYPEQVTIAQPLTLKGITSANAGQAVITVPGSGLAAVTTGFGISIAAMVDVTAGPVNISDITVDGTSGTVVEGTWLAGILYNDGSSGTVNEITARNLAAGGEGIGIWAENATGTNESVTIENSSFHDIDSAVLTWGGALLATVKGNTMEDGGAGVQWLSAGSITGNVINGGTIGIYVSASAPITVSGNTVANSTYGMQLTGGVTATSNKISNASVAFYDQGGGNTYKLNTITKAGVGIEFNCQSPTVLSNTINDATTGLDFVPASFSSANSFNNVATLRTGGC